MANKNYWVLKRPNGWAVKGEGNEKASKITDTQKEAIDFARKLAKSNNSELIITGEDGKIRAKDSQGNDPESTKG